jgi:alanyl-tRNA synthetase
MQIQIDIPHRYACMRAHTATHLLHAELAKIFPQTRQAWSYVWPDELRFDFFSDRSLTREELQHITSSIDTSIYQNHTVSMTEMPYEEAIQTWAKAFFEDTYPEIVRVVRVGDTDQTLSVELCGGTHVTETSQIGAFCIIEQTAVAAGTKRISAYTGPKVATYVTMLNNTLDQIADKVGVPTKQLESKIDKLLTENKNSSDMLDALAKQYVRTLWTGESMASFHDQSLNIILPIDTNPLAQTLWFATMIDALRWYSGLQSRLIYNTSGQYALFAPNAKILCKELGLKGWWSDTFVQGRDENIVKTVEH